MDVCPDSLENMEKQKTAEQSIKVRCHNGTELLGGSKLMEGIIISGFKEGVTAEMKNLNEEFVSIKDKIKEIKCNREKELVRKRQIVGRT